MDTRGSAVKGGMRRISNHIRSLFLLVVLIPIIAIATASYLQVKTTLVEQAYEELLEQSRYHSNRLLERLIRTRDTLAMLQQSAAADTVDQPGSPLATAMQMTQAIFIAGREADAAHGLKSVYRHSELDELSPPRWDNAAGRSAVIIDKAGANIWLSVSTGTNPGTPNGGLLALLDKQYLFGDEFDYLLPSNFCISADRLILFCTTLAAQYSGEIATSQNSGRTKTGSNKIIETDGVFALDREVFLRSQFESTRWTMLTMEEKATVFAPIQTFRTFFFSIVVLLILGLLLLVTVQTRRQFKPLEVLRQGALKLGSGDFSTRIDVTSHDEFEELAESFNSMAARLGSQFEFLTMMSNVDSMLLQQPNRRKVARAIVREVPEQLDLSIFGVLVLESPTDSAMLFYYDAESPDQVKSQTLQVTATLLDCLKRNDSRHCIVDGALAGSLETPLSTGERLLRAYPLAESNDLYGALCVSEHEITAATSETEERLINVSARLTVALSTVDRQRKLYEQAHYDDLTGLPNRGLFIDRLEHLIRHAARKHTRVAVIYADLDRFKSVNDSHGHFFGDEILRETARRFSGLVRKCDTVARLSGDEFAFALPDIRESSEVYRIVSGVVDLVKQPFALEGNDFRLDVSLGVSFYPDNGDSGEELLKSADLAMYRAKVDPGTHYCLFEEAMNTEISERSKLGQDLIKAIEQNELSLVYQPKVDTKSHQIRSAEALIRWNHPAHGWISPAKFIPIAEDTGCIQAIGEFALRRACEQMAQWRAAHLNIEQVAVNVSPLQVLYSDLPTIVAAELARHELEPDCLELEITESLLIDDYSRTEAVLAKLHSMGVSLAIDDFGTGYSSLAHIHQLSFDTIKIDKCFVDELLVSPGAEAIIDSIIAMARSLEMNIVAEGVGSREQLRLLENKSCHLYQGYFFSKPVTADELGALLTAEQPLPRAANDLVGIEQQPAHTNTVRTSAAP